MDSRSGSTNAEVVDKRSQIVVVVAKPCLLLLLLYLHVWTAGTTDDLRTRHCAANQTLLRLRNDTSSEQAR